MNYKIKCFYNDELNKAKEKPKKYNSVKKKKKKKNMDVGLTLQEKYQKEVELNKTTKPRFYTKAMTK